MITMTKPDLNKDKLDAAIHYVIAHVASPSNLGAVKLNKVLWFTDLELMYKAGRTLCGETFIKMPQGPWGTHVNKALKRLEQTGAITEGERSYFGYRQRQFFSLRRPNIVGSGLTPDEIDVLSRMIESICLGRTASSISEVTHNDIWHRTRDRGVMPASCVFECLLISPSEEDLKWAVTPLDPDTESELAMFGLT
jgi:hypothetical protein